MKQPYGRLDTIQFDMQLRAFLAAFKGATERAWANLSHELTEELVLSRRFVGIVHRHDTRWGIPLTPAEVSRAEAVHGLAFPRDYRVMLEVLGQLGPLDGVGFSGPAGELIVSKRWRFLHPLLEESSLRKTRVEVFEHIVSDAPGWLVGSQPVDGSLLTTRLHNWMAANGELWPLYGHRSLVCSEHALNSVVLSIYNASDIVVYGRNIVEYLINEFGEWIDDELMAKGQELAALLPTDVNGWSGAWDDR